MDSLTLPRAIEREQEMKFGTQILKTGVRFRLWAPDARAVAVKIYEPQQIVPMHALPRGWFEVDIEGARPGDLYRFVLEDGTEVPDPASRFQPEDVDGPSEIIDPRRYKWSDQGWRGRPWHEAIIYELHIGTFTPEGTYRAATAKLDYLAGLGVTALQIMPLADFAGRWNWGYDGVHLFAPDSTYGRPDDLKAFIDAAHERNLMVFLDVVYNHFGPKGNYLNIYAPLTTAKHATPWGPAVNFDDEGSRMIRDFVFANARYWLNEYRFDGLRFDAVHEIADTGPKHMLQDLAEQTRAATDGRYVHLIAENSLNQAGWLERRDDGSAGLYTAQWADDIHHGLHVAVTGESSWYYKDYHGRLDLLTRALAEGLSWQGETSDEKGRTKGEPSGHLPPTAFVSFIQNHDQIGNRPFGDRLASLAPPQAVRTLAAIMLLSPQIPMLFMGEEWAADMPFLFFSDVGDDLANAIRESRQQELKDFYADSPPDRTPPDPMSEAAFAASKLRWGHLDDDDHARLLRLYKRLIGLRKEQIVPRLEALTENHATSEIIGPCAFRVSWQLADGAELSVVANLSADPLTNVQVWGDDHLWLEGFATGDTLEGYSAVFRLRPPAP